MEDIVFTSDSDIESVPDPNDQDNWVETSFKSSNKQSHSIYKDSGISRNEDESASDYSNDDDNDDDDEIPPPPPNTAYSSEYEDIRKQLVDVQTKLR